MYGIAAAVVCALHCSAAPLLAVVAPLLAFEWIEHPAIEWSLVAVSIATSSAAVGGGWRRHRDRAPVIMLALGVGMLLLVRLTPAFDETTERVVVLSAAAALVAAHVLNLHRLRAPRPAA
jgi:hypothetical protein